MQGTLYLYYGWHHLPASQVPARLRGTVSPCKGLKLLRLNASQHAPGLRAELCSGHRHWRAHYSAGGRTDVPALLTNLGACSRKAQRPRPHITPEILESGSLRDGPYRVAASSPSATKQRSSLDMPQASTQSSRGQATSHCFQLSSDSDTDIT